MGSVVSVNSTINGNDFHWERNQFNQLVISRGNVNTSNDLKKNTTFNFTNGLTTGQKHEGAKIFIINSSFENKSKRLKYDSSNNSFYFVVSSENPIVGEDEKFYAVKYGQDYAIVNKVGGYLVPLSLTTNNYSIIGNKQEPVKDSSVITWRFSQMPLDAGSISIYDTISTSLTYGSSGTGEYNTTGNTTTTETTTPVRIDDKLSPVAIFLIVFFSLVVLISFVLITYSIIKSLL